MTKESRVTTINEAMLESIIWVTLLKKNNGETTEDIIEFINKIMFK